MKKSKYVKSLLTITTLLFTTAFTLNAKAQGNNLMNTYGQTFESFGTCINSRELKDPAKLSAVKEQYNSITLENEMKPSYLLRNNPVLITITEAKNLGYYIPDTYTDTSVPKINFDTVDEVLKICYENNLAVRFHTLVWHAQTPEWFFKKGYNKNNDFVSSAQMDGRVEFYIKTVMRHIYNSPYGSIVYAWDVVNEHFHAAEGSGWITIYDEKDSTNSSYIKKAFQYANETLNSFEIRDKVSLIYNDFNCYMEKNKIISLINFLNKDSRLCDGIGMQSHLAATYPSPDLFTRTINDFLNLGIEVQITEFDATDASRVLHAEYLYNIFAKTLKVKKENRNGDNLTGFTFWGMSDEQSWRGSSFPLLYKDLATPKDSYYAVLKAYHDVMAPADYSYDFNTLTPGKHDGAVCDISPSSGFLKIDFNKQYGEAKFHLPAEIDLEHLESISIVAKSDQNITFKFYNNDYEEVYKANDCSSPLGTKFVFEPQDKEQVITSIGIMAQNTGTSSAVVQSISFAYESKPANRSSLSAAIEKAEVIVSDTYLTDIEKNILLDAIQKAKSFFIKETVTKSEVLAEVKSLNASIYRAEMAIEYELALIKKSILSAAIEKAEVIVSDTYLTDIEKNILLDAIQKAKGVFTDETVTETEVLAEVTSLNDSIYRAEMAIEQAKTAKIPVQSVILDKSSLPLEVKGTRKLTYTVLPANAGNKQVDWKSSNISVATVDASGKITAKKAGIAEITVTSADGSKTASCKVTVKAPTITLNVSSVPLKVKQTTTAVKIKSSSIAGEKIVSADTKDKKIVKVSVKNGKLHITGKKKGNATVTIITTHGGTVNLKVNVTKDKVITKNLAISETKVTLTKGKKITLKAIRTPITSIEKLKWTSSNKKVATVTGKGTVTAKGKGTAIITVKSPNGRKKTCKVTVI